MNLKTTNREHKMLLDNSNSALRDLSRAIESAEGLGRWSKLKKTNNKANGHNKNNQSTGEYRENRFSNQQEINRFVHFQSKREKKSRQEGEFISAGRIYIYERKYNLIDEKKNWLIFCFHLFMTNNSCMVVKI